MDIDFLKILFYVLCFQFLFVSVFLFQNKKGKTISNKLLATFFLLISIAVIDLYFLIFSNEILPPKYLLLIDSFMLTYGPLLFLFTQSVLFKKYKLQKKHFLHFLPLLIFFCFLFFVVITIDSNSINQITKQNSYQQIPIYYKVGDFIILSHIFYYLVKSKKEIKKVVDKAKNLYSTFNQENYKLLKFILNSFIFLFLLSFIHSILPVIGIEKRLLITLLLMILFMFYFINSVLLKMLNQTSKQSGIIGHLDFKEKYADSRLSKQELNEYLKMLSLYMKEKQRYLDSELSISDLSNELNIPAKTLSQVINEGCSCNFFDFVNSYRVEEAKSTLKRQKASELTIQQVMYSSGFNSKSSFNMAFKKFTNLTPTQFRNSL